MERKVVLVLTPGRSGSSVFTHILSVLGLRLSENLISATEENPQGYFEDAQIVQRERDFLCSLGLTTQIPLTPSCLSSQEAGNYVRFLKEYLEQQVSEDGIWLCKVPTLCSTLPLWQKAMRQSRIVPFYFLAVRNLSDTLTSFMKLGNSKQWAEQTIFTRTVNVFQHVQSNLFIQHYEHLFDNFEQTVQKLGAWLDLPLDQDRIEQARQCVKPHLNRAQYEQVTPDNPFLIQLYEHLSACYGGNSDIAPLLHYISAMKPAFSLGETAVDRLLSYHKQTMTQQEKKYIKLQKEKEDLIKSHARELEKCKQEYTISLQALIKKHESEKKEIEQRLATEISDLQALIEKHESEKKEIEQRLATDTSTLCALNASQENTLYALRQEIRHLLQENHALQQLQTQQDKAPTLKPQYMQQIQKELQLIQKQNQLKKA